MLLLRTKKIIFWYTLLIYIACYLYRKYARSWAINDLVIECTKEDRQTEGQAKNYKAVPKFFVGALITYISEVIF